MNNEIIYIFDNCEVDKHIPISRLPETPERTQAVRDALTEYTSSNTTVKIDWFKPTLLDFEVFLNLARLVHSNDYLIHLTSTLYSAESTKMNLTVSQDDEALVSEESKSALCAALSCVCHATEMVTTGQIKKIFCNIRPPGHHCLKEKAMGFCVVNNVAVGVEYALCILNKKDCANNKKIAIVDWDNHHFNGTQEIFYDNPNVLCISLHATYKEHYPFTGKPEETGNHDNIVNINLETGAGHRQVVRIFRDVVIPKLEDFGVDMIFISCGFDAHHLDPVGVLKYDADTYTHMTSCLVDFADKHCEGRIISVLEGGYNVTALKESSVAHVKALAKIE